MRKVNWKKNKSIFCRWSSTIFNLHKLRLSVTLINQALLLPKAWKVPWDWPISEDDGFCLSIRCCPNRWTSLLTGDSCGLSQRLGHCLHWFDYHLPHPCTQPAQPPGQAVSFPLFSLRKVPLLHLQPGPTGSWGQWCQKHSLHSQLYILDFSLLGLDQHLHGQVLLLDFFKLGLLCLPPAWTPNGLPLFNVCSIDTNGPCSSFALLYEHRWDGCQVAETPTLASGRVRPYGMEVKWVVKTYSLQTFVYLKKLSNLKLFRVRTLK